MPLNDPAVVQAALDLEEAQHALCQAAVAWDTVGADEYSVLLAARNYVIAKNHYTSVSDAT